MLLLLLAFPLLFPLALRRVGVLAGDAGVVTAARFATCVW